MPSANQAAETLQLLTSIEQTDVDLRELGSQVQALRDLIPDPPSAAELRRQEEAAQLEQQTNQSAVSNINSLIERYDLSDDQQFASFLSGDLPATIDFQLQQQLDTLATRDPDNERIPALRRAREIVALEADAFRAENPDAVDFRGIDRERARDLASPDGFFGFVERSARTALAGIPGLAGIAASAAGAEGAGQALGEVAEGIQAGAPTDIGSAAASAEFARVNQQLQDGEIGIAEATQRIGSLAVDGDFIADLGATTVGAAAGGGAVRGVASGAAAVGRRVLGSEARDQAQDVATDPGFLSRAVQEAGSVAPAVGVGLGAGVDGDLTTEQARILALTGGASAATGGLLGAAGARVAESALGGLASRLPGAGRIPGVRPRTTGSGVGSADAQNAGVLGQIAGGARGTAGTFAAEGIQEGIEGAGEAFGEFAQERGTGVFETFANPEAQRRAAISAATQAPLGGVVGGPIGAARGVSDVRQTNRQNDQARQLQADTNEAFETNRQLQQEEATAINRDLQQDEALETNRLLDSLNASTDRNNQILQNRQDSEDLIQRQREAAQQRDDLITQRQADPSFRRQFERDPDIDPLSLTPAQQRAAVEAETNGAERDILAFLEDTAGDPDFLRSRLDLGLDSLEIDLRAAFRAQEGVNLDTEDLFINAALTGTDFDNLIPQQSAQIIEEAFEFSQSDTAVQQLNQSREASARQQNAVIDQQTTEDVSNITAQEEAQAAQDRQAAITQATTDLRTDFQGVLTERANSTDSLDLSEGAAQNVSLNDTLLPVARGDVSAPVAQGTVNLYNRVRSGDVAQAQNLFTALAEQTPALQQNDSLIDFFATRMAGAVGRFTTPRQMAQEVDRILDIYGGVDTLQAIADLNTAPIAEILRAYDPVVQGYFETDVDGQTILTEEGTQALQQLSTTAPETISNYADQVDPDGSIGVQQRLQELQTTLINFDGDIRDGEQADSLASALTELDYINTLGQTEAQTNRSIRASNAGRRGARTAAANRARRAENGTDGEFVPNDPSEIDATPNVNTDPDLDGGIATGAEPSGQLNPDTTFDSDGNPTEAIRQEISEFLDSNNEDTRLAAEFFRENRGQEGTPAARTLRTQRANVAEASRKLEAGETLTQTEQNRVLTALNNRRRGADGKKLETPSEGTSRSSRTQAPSSVTGRAPIANTDASQNPEAFDVDKTRAAIAEYTSDWPSTPDIQVVQSNADLPANLRPTNGSVNAGITDGSTVYIVADQISSELQLVSVLEEELFHRGISKSLGGNYDSVLSSIFNKRGGVSGLLGLARQYRVPASFDTLYQDLISNAQSGNKEAQTELTDEILARVAQSPNLPRGIIADINRVVARVRRFIRRFLGQDFLDSVSDADLLLIISDANREGRIAGGSGPQRLRSSKQFDGDFADFQNGENVIGNLKSGTFRPDTSAVEDVRIGATNFWTDLKSFDIRERSLGQRFFRSNFWNSLNTKLANSKFALNRNENEFRLMSREQVEGIFNAVSELDLPPLLRDAFPNNEELRHSYMSLHSAATTYMGRADALAKSRDPDGLRVLGDKTMAQVMEEHNDAYKTFASIRGVNPTEAKRFISRGLNALHAPERNRTAWLKNVELTDSDASAERDALFNNVPDDPDAARARIEALVEANAVTPVEQYVGSGMSNAEAEVVLQGLRNNNDQYQAFLEVAKATRNLIEATNNVKRRNGSYSNSFDAFIRMYGWENYVPLQGRGGDPDGNDNIFVPHYSNDVFNATVRPWQGRESLVEDIFDNTHRIAISAMEQLAAQDFIKKVAFHTVASSQTSEYVEGFSQDGAGGRLFEGTVVELDINSPEFKRVIAKKNRQTLVYYNPNNDGATDQTALVIKLTREEGADAVLGARSAMADNVDAIMREKTIGGVGIHDVTSFTASTKTWRNPPHIIYDALRNMLTLGYIANTEFGERAGQGFLSYVRQFTQPGFSNYARDVYRVSNLWGRGRFDELAELVKSEGPNSTVAELNEFIRLGGPTSQLAALRDVTPGSIESLNKLGGPTGRQQIDNSLEKMDELFTTWNAAADTLSRFAFYKAAIADGVPKDVAAARAKNTANFEQRGTYIGPLSGVFEFFRSTASGNTALINSTLTGRHGRETMGMAFGAGLMIYSAATLFAGQDDEENDNLGKVNGKLYNNNFVFQFGDDNGDRIQFGLGFGPVAWALSAGMQTARLLNGHQSFDQTFENLSEGLVNQYNVVPSTGINLFTNPVEGGIDTITPSVLKPFVQVAFNMNGLGVPIRSDFGAGNTGGVLDSFQGRFNSEQEFYDSMTQELRNQGFADINPDNLRHVLRASFGGLTYMAESVFENFKYFTDEDFSYNRKAGLYPIRNFFGSDFSQTPTDFYNHYGRMDQLDKRAAAHERTGNPEAAAQIRSSEFYQNNLAQYESATARIREINDEHRDVFRNDATTTAEKRQVQELRDAQRYELFNEYLESITN